VDRPFPNTTRRSFAGRPALAARSGSPLLASRRRRPAFAAPAYLAHRAGSARVGRVAVGRVFVWLPRHLADAKARARARARRRRRRRPAAAAVGAACPPERRRRLRAQAEILSGFAHASEALNAHTGESWCGESVCTATIAATRRRRTLLATFPRGVQLHRGERARDELLARVCAMTRRRRTGRGGRAFAAGKSSFAAPRHIVLGIDPDHAAAKAGRARRRLP